MDLANVWQSAHVNFGARPVGVKTGFARGRAMMQGLVQDAESQKNRKAKKLAFTRT